MVFFILIQIFIIDTILTLIFRIANANPDQELTDEEKKGLNDIKKEILSGIFPLLLLISTVISSVLFVITPVNDKE